MKRLVLLALLVFSGCVEEFPEADLPRVYIASHHGDTATLSLRSDHTYTHTIRRGDGQILTSEGAWKSILHQKQTYIEFPDFQVVPYYGLLNPNRVRNRSWTIAIERTYLRSIEICFDDDVGYCYIQQSNS